MYIEDIIETLFLFEELNLNVRLQLSELFVFHRGKEMNKNSLSSCSLKSSSGRDRIPAKQAPSGHLLSAKKTNRGKDG